MRAFISKKSKKIIIAVSVVACLIVGYHVVHGAKVVDGIRAVVWDDDHLVGIIYQQNNPAQMSTQEALNVVFGVYPMPASLKRQNVPTDRAYVLADVPPDQAMWAHHSLGGTWAIHVHVGTPKVKGVWL